MEILSPVLRMLQDKYGYKFKDEIGRGTNGIAYDIGENKVLKVTSNRNEAIAASYIKKYPNLKNIAKISRVFTTKNKYFDKYYIEQEKLNKIGLNEEWDDIYEYFIEKQNYGEDFTSLIKEINKTPETKKIISKYNKNEIDFLCYLYKTNSWNDIEFELEKFNQKFLRFKKQFNDLINGLNELKKIGIDFYDIHARNIMKNSSGTYKFVDIVWHQLGDKLEIIDEKKKINLFNESKIKYATTNAQKAKGLKGIELEDWSGLMVFKNVKEGDIFVGEGCLFDIRIAFLDSLDRVLTVGTIRQGDGRVIAPKNTNKAIESASDDDYNIIKGSIFKIPATKSNFNPVINKRI